MTAPIAAAASAAETAATRPPARPRALITGASAGIGRVFADRLAARGHDLVVVGRDAGRLTALAGELGTTYGISVEIFPADLSRDDEVTRLVQRVSAGPPLAVLVNNAGFGATGRLATVPPEPQVAMVHLHTLAPMRVTQAALPAMLAWGAGAVINVSSVASFIFSAGNVNYCATKAYLTVFSEGLAAELAGTGVRVQALCPGFTHTEFHQRMGLDKRSIRGALWLSAEYVVDYSLASLDRGGPVVCVPGLRYKLLVAAIRLTPRWLLGRVTRR